MTEIGDEIAGCRLDELIGEGGMGVVWKATQVSLDRTVAMKIVRPEFAASEDYRERFVAESRFAASLEDTNVVSIHDAGEDDGDLFLVMSFVEGTDLRALLDSSGSLDPSSAVAVISQVASGLQAVHDAGLVHRDVKPANVLIRERDGEALLTDFGVARAAEATQLTRTGMLVGTLDYMAPEQIEGEELDGAADIYSLGAVLFEALTGEPPFTRKTVAAQINAHLNLPPPKPSEHDPELLAFDSVIESALSKDPADRPPSALAFAEAARAALGEEAKTTARFRDTVADVSHSSAESEIPILGSAKTRHDSRGRRGAFSTTIGESPKTGSRKRVALALAAVLGLLALGAVALLGGQSGQGSGDDNTGASDEPGASTAGSRDSGTQAKISGLAGTWVGEATQYAPRGTTQKVWLRTSIDPTGLSGKHSESISGPRGTDRCRGTLSRLSYGQYRYREEADSSCIATTSIQLRLTGTDTMEFRERYRTQDGEPGQVVGSLRRTSSTPSGASAAPAATGAAPVSTDCENNDKAWPGTASTAGVTSTRGVSCQEAVSLLMSAPRPTGSVVQIPGWACRKDGEEIEAIYTRCTQGNRSIRILFGL